MKTARKHTWRCFASLALVVYATSMMGWWGASIQSMGITFTVVAGFVGLIELTLKLSLNLFVSQRVETELSNVTDSIEPSSDDDRSRLKSSVDSLQHQESIMANRYREGGCSAEDVIRAQALRLQAEIAWIRERSVLGQGNWTQPR